MPKIYSKYSTRVDISKRGEVPNPNTPCYVDKVGFISMEQQIKSLINAGINLENYRRSEYEYQYGMEQDIDSAVVSPENDYSLMPSVDMPQITNEFIKTFESANSKRSEEVKTEGNNNESLSPAIDNGESTKVES